MAPAQAEPWVAEAIIDFLRGPLYIHPLMEFIDEKCLIFTTEDENKLEYTQVHNEFKELVDRLLTNFLEELGTRPEEFYQTIADQLDKDKFTEFVVNTILTVDDFLMFKAMMVKRNVDLTNQVLEAMEELRKAQMLQQQEQAQQASKAEKQPAAAAKAGKEGKDEELEVALQASLSVHDAESRSQNLLRMMRAMQLEDEDVALGIATAESFKESVARQAEVAELEMAIALSLALEEERKKMGERPKTAAQQQQKPSPAPAAPPPAPAPASAPTPASTSSAGKPAATPGAGTSAPAAPAPAAPAPAAAPPAAAAAAPTPAPAAAPPAAAAAPKAGQAKPAGVTPPALQHRPFPEPKPTDLGPMPKLETPGQAGAKRAPAAVEPLAPLNVAPNQGSEKLSTVAAAAAAAASAAAPPPVQAGAPKAPAQPRKEAAPAAPAPLKVEDKPLQGPSPSETPKRFVPAPLNLDAPSAARSSTASAASPSQPPPDSSRSLGKFNSSLGSQASRGAGYSSAAGTPGGKVGGSTDLAAVRQAAMEAAATQKNLMLGKKAEGNDNDPANAWLKDAKLKLVQQKKMEREREMQAYKASEQGQKAPKKIEGTGDDQESRRAALREQLASKFKQDMIQQ